MYQKSIFYAPVKDLDFTSAKGRKKKIDDTLEGPITSIAKRQQKSLAVSSPSDNEISKFYKALSECGSRPATLSATLLYANLFHPKTSLSNFPQPLPERRVPNGLRNTLGYLL